MSTLPLLTLLLSLAASTWGTSTGVFPAILTTLTLNLTPRLRATLTAAYYLGTLTAHLLLAAPLTDRLGRKRAAVTGTLTISLGAVVIACAGGTGGVVLGRLVEGLGAGVVSSVVPLYAAEVAPAKDFGSELRVCPVKVKTMMQTGGSSPSSQSSQQSSLQQLSSPGPLSRHAGFCRNTATLFAGAAEMTAKLPMTAVEMWAIDALGRRFCLLAGCLVMSVALLLSIKETAHRIQIFPTPFRARGLNWAASGGALGSLVVSFVWPIGIAHLGSAVYFIFMALTLVCLPIIYFFYPETTGRPLENMEVLFARQTSPLLEPHDAFDEDAPLLSM
ncbi:hypothetical protein CDD80_3505 [Ophiocordyceps camponoti-rufipedis]|uniref:Major facilitator superfamily (MFS) profile domain-containing protein n=1 Tax=Ophiocordyceps camponoti-rufipedis TaxID=2004952 RepID=A0A2C5Z1Q5_9HYPO|nr:hypothetical protein CDD80_3505 [Ophiocordyceps camponoti-rufipedis]